LKIDEHTQREHVLPDGTRILLRLIRPDDGDELRQGFARLSPATRYYRFFSELPRLSDAMVDYLTQVDGINHVAIIAEMDSPDLKTGTGLGIARFIRLEEDPTVAEAAVTVIDEAQGRGIGKLLLAALADAARERGIKTFRGQVLASNETMRHLLDELGANVRSDDGEVLVFDVPLSHASEGEAEHHEHPLQRLLRAAAESIAALRRFSS